MTNIWISPCSIHREPVVGCSICTEGKWVSAEELEADSRLYQDDFRAWYAKHNDGAEPDESAWSIWKQLSQKAGSA
jgi:hypothetical protein